MDPRSAGAGVMFGTDPSAGTAWSSDPGASPRIPSWSGGMWLSSDPGPAPQAVSLTPLTWSTVNSVSVGKENFRYIFLEGTSYRRMYRIRSVCAVNHRSYGNSRESDANTVEGRSQY